MCCCSGLFAFCIELCHCLHFQRFCFNSIDACQKEHLQEAGAVAMETDGEHSSKPSRLEKKRPLTSRQELHRGLEQERQTNKAIYRALDNTVTSLRVQVSCNWPLALAPYLSSLHSIALVHCLADKSQQSAKGKVLCTQDWLLLSVWV